MDPHPTGINGVSFTFDKPLKREKALNAVPSGMQSWIASPLNEHFSTVLGGGVSFCRTRISDWISRNTIVGDGSRRLSIIDEVKQSGRVLKQCADRNRRTNLSQECGRWQSELLSECLTYNE